MSKSRKKPTAEVVLDEAALRKADEAIKAGAPLWAVADAMSVTKERLQGALLMRGPRQ